jgi:hypothetical protein
MLTKQNINITEDMKQAAKTVFIAMAFTETIRPIVEDYQQKILNELKPKDVYRNEVITNPKYSYQMNDSDFQVYLKRCNEERIKAKLHVESEEYCPLLVAEDLQRQAERSFIDIMEPITHLSADKVLCSKDGLDNYKKLIDLSLRLLAPYVNNKL